MNVKSIVLVFFFVLFFTLINSAPTQAHVECSYGNHILKIQCAASDELFKKNETCLNKECSVKVSKIEHPMGQGTKLSVLYFDFKETPTSPDMYMNRTISSKDGARDYGIIVNEQLLESGITSKKVFADTLNMICKGSIKPVGDVLSSRIKDWYRALQKSGGANLTFQENTFALDEIPDAEKNIKECVYNDIQTYGNWRVVEQKVKDYCSAKSSENDTSCPNIMLKSAVLSQTSEAKMPEKKSSNFAVTVTSVLGLLMAVLIIKFVIRKRRLLHLL